MDKVSSLFRRAAWLVVSVACTVTATLAGSPAARSDATAYLVNVTVRPGYNFANADQALAYGQQICGQVGAGDEYDTMIAHIKSDFATSDDYQASYLITQAVNELCPAMIWQLRKSAARQEQLG
ncbi:DUF732 domain-containing protein [Mycolicibacterium stellerae]|uniref:DUF732 domain-containing protein n=1 Tax=Mycolicibacterium stellerae TaxID=2358193 RepID=UPI000F0BB555|nr:DUF732 domain-containing protein [Mycolicibacterium stellerae]